MSASRPARCLFTNPPMGRPIHRCQNFHTSPNLCDRRRPKTKSVKAEDMGLIRPRFADITKREGRLPLSLADGPLKKIPSEQLFRPYSEEAKAALSKRYTAEQIRVIEAGEEAISHKDLKSHGMFRDDRYGLPYLDDLSKHSPLLDKKIQQEDGIEGPVEFMNEEEQRAAIADWMQQFEGNSHVAEDGQMDADSEWEQRLKRQAEGREEDQIDDEGEFDFDSMDEKESRPNELDFYNFLHDKDAFIKGKKPKPIEFELDGQKHTLDTIAKGKPDNSVVNYALPKTKDPDVLYQKKGERGDEDGMYEQLKKQTKMSLDEILDIKVKLLVRHRVVNQTRLGKIQSQYVLAIAGNGKGLLGIGEGKSTEPEEASKQARLASIRNMKPIPMYENRTIYGDVFGKVSAAEVSLFSRPPGFGLRVQHNIFEMARAAGLQDLSARVPRSRNKMNTIKATFQALMSQRIPDEIARGRGKKLVDVRKVYYAGRSPA